MIIMFGLLAFYRVLIWIAGGLLDGTGLDPAAAPRGAQEFMQILLALIGFFTWYGYFLVQELGPRGATLGKRITGIRVAARGGGRLTPEAVIARNLLRDIEVFYPLGGRTPARQAGRCAERPRRSRRTRGQRYNRRALCLW
jgi:uncharacterized RDD family membrane protein YckC